jgi:hypothetical protein
MNLPAAGWSTKHAKCRRDRSLRNFTIHALWCKGIRRSVSDLAEELDELSAGAALDRIDVDEVDAERVAGRPHYEVAQPRFVFSLE